MEVKDCSEVIKMSLLNDHIKILMATHSNGRSNLVGQNNFGRFCKVVCGVSGNFPNDFLLAALC